MIPLTLQPTCGKRKRPRVEHVALFVVRYDTAHYKRPCSFRSYHQSRVSNQRFHSVNCRCCVAHSNQMRPNQPLSLRKTRYFNRGHRDVNVYCRKKLSNGNLPTSAHAPTRGTTLARLLRRLNHGFPTTLAMKRHSLGPRGTYPSFSTTGRCGGSTPHKEP